MIQHHIQRKGPKLRVVVELDFNEVLAHLDNEGMTSKLATRLDVYLANIRRDILEVARILAEEPEQGVVKWFDDSKGFGFIRGRESKDIFVHQKNIAVDGYRTLEAGQQVRFKRRVVKESVEAIEVQPMEPHA